MTPFKFEIITPERVVFDDMTEGIIVRTTVGDKGILAKHEPYVAALGIGQIKVKIDGAYRVAAVATGIIKVNKEKTTLLAQSFEWADEIDLNRARKAEEKAQHDIEQYAEDEKKLDMAEYKLKRAINRIDAANRH